MGLNLTVKLGGRVYVGDRPITVTEIIDVTSVLVKDDSGKEYRLSAEDVKEIYPDVLIYLGHRNLLTSCTLTFDAPQSTIILREELYQPA